MTSPSILKSKKKLVYAINLGVMILGMLSFDLFDVIRVSFGNNNQFAGNIALSVYFALIPIFAGFLSGFISPNFNNTEVLMKGITLTGGILYIFIVVLWFNNYLIFMQSPFLILQSIFVIVVLVILLLFYFIHSQKYSYIYGNTFRLRIQSN